MSYHEYGFTILPKFFGGVLEDLLEEYRELANAKTGACWRDAWDPGLLAWFQAFPSSLSQIYDAAKQLPTLKRLEEKLRPSVEKLIGPCRALEKKPFRIDLPRDTKELAHWHQDRQYLEAEGYYSRTVVAWIPLQDVTWYNGCLSIMPSSHNEPFLHDLSIGKKQIPTSIFDREVRYVEMRRGDVLLFDSWLLHSGNMNWSDKIRYSVQIRWEAC